MIANRQIAITNITTKHNFFSDNFQLIFKFINYIIITTDILITVINIFLYTVVWFGWIGFCSILTIIGYWMPDLLYIVVGKKKKHGEKKWPRFYYYHNF